MESPTKRTPTLPFLEAKSLRKPSWRLRKPLLGSSGLPLTVPTSAGSFAWLRGASAFLMVAGAAAGASFAEARAGKARAAARQEASRARRRRVIGVSCVGVERAGKAFVN